jgi:hypothetical protein
MHAANTDGPLPEPTVACTLWPAHEGVEPIR